MCHCTTFDPKSRTKIFQKVNLFFGVQKYDSVKDAKMCCRIYTRNVKLVAREIFRCGPRPIELKFILQKHFCFYSIWQSISIDSWNAKRFSISSFLIVRPCNVIKPCGCLIVPTLYACMHKKVKKFKNCSRYRIKFKTENEHSGLYKNGKMDVQLMQILFP